MWNSLIQPAQKPTGVLGLTGAAPQTGTGLTQPMIDVEPATLSANVYAKATTSTLTLTAKWQVSDDGATWIDAYGSNRAANVAIVTGTGSAVTDTIAVTAPEAVYGHRYSRLLVVSGVGVGGGAGVDEFSISYNFTLRQQP